MSNTQFPELNEAMREMGQNIASEIDRLQAENEAFKARGLVLVGALGKLSGMKLNMIADSIVDKALASVKGGA
jgi:hypothetical protein